MEWWQILMTIVVGGVTLDMIIVSTLNAYGKIVLVRETLKNGGLEKLDLVQELSKK